MTGGAVETLQAPISALISDASRSGVMFIMDGISSVKKNKSMCSNSHLYYFDMTWKCLMHVPPSEHEQSDRAQMELILMGDLGCLCLYSVKSETNNSSNLNNHQHPTHPEECLTQNSSAYGGRCTRPWLTWFRDNHMSWRLDHGC